MIEALKVAGLTIVFIGFLAAIYFGLVLVAAMSDKL